MGRSELQLFWRPSTNCRGILLSIGSFFLFVRFVRGWNAVLRFWSYSFSAFAYCFGEVLAVNRGSDRI